MPTKDSPASGDDDGERDDEGTDAPGGRQTDLEEVADSPEDEATSRAATEIDDAADAALEGDADGDPIPDIFNDPDDYEGDDFNGTQVLVGDEVYHVEEFAEGERGTEFLRVVKPLTGDEGYYVTSVYDHGIAPLAVDGVREVDEVPEPPDADTPYDEAAWGDPPDDITDFEQGDELLVDTGRIQTATVKWSADAIASTVLNDWGTPHDIKPDNTDEIIGYRRGDTPERLSASEVDNPAEVVDTIPFPSRGEGEAAEVQATIKENIGQLRDDDVAVRVVDHIDQFKDEMTNPHVDTVAGDDRQRASVNIGRGDEGALTHEFAHLVMDAHGYNIQRVGVGPRNPAVLWDATEDNFVDLNPDEKGHQLQKVGDADSPAEVDRLVDAVNDGWQRLQRAGAENAEDYAVKNNYSGTNAHEFAARLHEAMQRETLTGLARDPPTWFDAHPDVVAAYTEVFDPSRERKEAINTWHELSDDSPFEETPYPGVGDGG